MFQTKKFNIIPDVGIFMQKNFLCDQNVWGQNQRVRNEFDTL